MDPQVALEQSGSTLAARVRSACRAFPKEPGLSARTESLRLGPVVLLICPLARRSDPTSLGFTPPTQPEACRRTASCPASTHSWRESGSDVGVCGTEICLTEGLWIREDLCFPLTLRQEERQPWGSLLPAGFPAKQSTLRVSSLAAGLCPKGAGVCPSHSPRKTTAL